MDASTYLEKAQPMKQIITLIAAIMIALRGHSAQASIKDEQRCNQAINQTAIYLKEQASFPVEAEALKKRSRADVERMIDLSNRIIEQCEIIISHCQLNREMTEGIVDLMIDNKDKAEKLSSDTHKQ